MSFENRLNKLKELLRVISEVESLPLNDEESRVVVKAIRELIEFLPSILEEVNYLVIDRATLNKELKHRGGYGKEQYRKGFIEASKMVTETEAISPTSRDVLNELIDRLEERIKDL